MSKVVHSFWTFFETVGRARAAHQLALLGYHEEAKEVMLRD